MFTLRAVVENYAMFKAKTTVGALDHVVDFQAVPHLLFQNVFSVFHVVTNCYCIKKYMML